MNICLFFTEETGSSGSNFREVPKEIVDRIFREAERVREVAAEFGDKVVLNEYPAHERETLLRYQYPRGIFANGKEIFWGYEAPKEGISEAIERALEEG